MALITRPTANGETGNTITFTHASTKVGAIGIEIYNAGAGPGRQ